MTDLFAAENALGRVEIPDADVFYVQKIRLPFDQREILARLIAETPWRQEAIVIWGKRHLQPRLIAWYGDRNKTYTYSGVKLTPLPWTDLLLSLRRAVENVAGCEFNSVLLNYYRNEHDSMGLHCDDEPELGNNPTIASLSVGDRRQFTLKHKKRRDLRPMRIQLESGSLLIMKGGTQAHWKHGINKESQPCGPRVNLTFRRIVSPG